jgi:hypothetical protein
MRTILLRPARALTAATYHATEHDGPHCEEEFVNDDGSRTVCSLDPNHVTDWHLSVGSETGTWFRVITDSMPTLDPRGDIVAVNEPVPS